MRPRKEKKLSAGRTGPRTDYPKTLADEITLNAAMLASDAGECWKNCRCRSCRDEQACQGEKFGKGEKSVACGPQWSKEQDHRFLGAKDFAFSYLLPKVPEGATADELALMNGGKDPYDVDLVILHVERGTKLEIVDGAAEKRLPFWVDAPQ
jgi:hypothetical protein